MCPLWRGLYLAWLGMCFCHMGLACTSSLFFPYFDRKGLLQFQGLPVGKVTSQLAQPKLFIWNWLGQSVAVNEFYIEMFCWCGDEKAEPALRQWNTDYVVVPATDSTIVLGLGLKVLKFMVFFSSCCWLGAMFWSFVREGWVGKGWGCTEYSNIN